MQFLLEAEKYVKELEAKIAQLEAANAAKDAEIKRLSQNVQEGKPADAAAPAAAASSAPAAASSAPAAAKPAATQGVKREAGPEALANLEGPRMKVPPKKEPSAADKAALCVYDDDEALGKPCPPLTTLQWFNGPAVTLGSKPVVLTFFSKLNKGDFSTLSVLSEISLEFGDSVAFCGVSRDGEESEVSKFAGKYQGKYFDELQSPTGEPGVTVYMTFPLAFDKDDAFNSALKTVMRKGTVGVGMTVLVDKAGIIRWYETFVRGVNPMHQLVDQIRAVLAGKPLLSNGNAPIVQAVEEEFKGDIPDVVDAFAKTGKY